MKNILLPTDFSDNAWSALVYILKLHDQNECTFYLLHSTNFTENANKSGVKTTENPERELLKLKGFAESSDANANHIFHIILSEKSLEDAIASTVKKHEIHMVVMGTEGKTGAKNTEFGSNTLNIIHNMRQCPIIVIPDAYEYTDLKQIAFVTDFKQEPIEKDLRSLKNMASNAKIRIVYTDEKLSAIQKTNMAYLGCLFADYDHSFHGLPTSEKAVSALHYFVETYKINMLAILNYKQHLMEAFIDQPQVNKIVFQPKIPLLIIQE